jgi:hypothetical protein
VQSGDRIRARTGMVAPDETTFAYVKGRRSPPKGDDSSAPSMCGARCRAIPTRIRHGGLARCFRHARSSPWGTSPEDTLPIDAAVPDPAQSLIRRAPQQMQGALDTWGLSPSQKLTDIRVDRVFIGSAPMRESRICATGGRCGARGPQAKVPGLVSAGSTQVKHQAEQEGLDKILHRGRLTGCESGCSMCIGINGDVVAPGERCASTTNRNFRGRQGPGARTAPDVARDGGGSSSHRPSRGCAPDAVGEGVMQAVPATQRRRGRAAAADNVDTDQVIPARFLKISRAGGFGRQACFHGPALRRQRQARARLSAQRSGAPGAEHSDRRKNFGVGSSREAAVYALGRSRHPLRGGDELRRHLRPAMR